MSVRSKRFRGKAKNPTPAEFVKEMWATPNTMDGMKHIRTPEELKKNSRGCAKSGNLREQVAHSLWPTPTSREWKGARTPEGLAKTGRNPLTNSLSDAIRHFPTPTATDSIKGGRVSPRPGAMGLSETLGGQLNAAWVEALMGYPPGWTSLDDGETDPGRKESPG
jgi:hypothetical protein